MIWRLLPFDQRYGRPNPNFVRVRVTRDTSCTGLRPILYGTTQEPKFMGGAGLLKTVMGSDGPIQEGKIRLL